MNRNEKRKAEREKAHIVKTAKLDMVGWVEDLGRPPTNEEATAWQKGYLSGLNRMKAEFSKES